jgi:hypothetical protein
MRIFLIAALICAAIAIICVIIPTTVLGMAALGWFIASWIGFILNELTGGTTGGWRVGPPPPSVG